MQKATGHPKVVSTVPRETLKNKEEDFGLRKLDRVVALRITMQQLAHNLRMMSTGKDKEKLSKCLRFTTRDKKLKLIQN